MMRKAFTLVELLVVIAIITILAALLMPTLEKVTMQAKAISCKNQMRQQYFTLTSYVSDSADYLPDSTSYFTDALYIYSSSPTVANGQLVGLGKLVPGYMQGSLDLFCCPSRNKPDLAKWKAIAATNYAGGTWATWIASYSGAYQGYIAHYACGWQYGDGWSSGRNGFCPVVFSSRPTTGPSRLKPTLGNYAVGGCKVLIADSNELNLDAPFKALFHNNGEIQNTLMVDGSSKHISNYWSILRPYMNFCWSGANHVYWNIGATNFYWWSCFGSGSHSK